MRVHEQQKVNQWGHDRAEIPTDPDDLGPGLLDESHPDPESDYYYPPEQALNFS